mmetsp:Transcript_25878/g.65801  ORF Transcript_25878/g.65801 Transcript_25878/m.65801 type:complete len:490 (+) Transcript_25878:126-1595(+)
MSVSHARQGSHATSTTTSALYYRMELAKRSWDDAEEAYWTDKRIFDGRCNPGRHDPNVCPQSAAMLRILKQQKLDAKNAWIAARKVFYVASQHFLDARLEREIRDAIATSKPPNLIDSATWTAGSRGQSRSSLRLALVMFGDLDFSFESSDIGVHLLGNTTFSLAELRRNLGMCVLDHARAKGVAVDIFAQSNSVSMQGLIRKLYSPVASHFHPYNLAQGGNMFSSIEAALRLRRAYEVRWGIRYDWVAAMRWDIYFTPLARFDVTELNPELFYSSIFCGQDMLKAARVVLPWHPKVLATSQASVNGTRICRPAKARSDDGNVSTVVEMDFYFASSPLNMDRVFIGLWPDYMAGKFERTDAVLNHGIFGGRLIFLGARVNGSHGTKHGLSQSTQPPLRMGRYLWHHYTHGLYRDLSPDSRACMQGSQHLFVGDSGHTADGLYQHNLKAEVPWSSDICAHFTPARYLCQCRPTLQQSKRHRRRWRGRNKM